MLLAKTADSALWKSRLSGVEAGSQQSLEEKKASTTCAVSVNSYFRISDNTIIFPRMKNRSFVMPFMTALMVLVQVGVSAQTVYLMPLSATVGTKDSVVTIMTERKRGEEWKDDGSAENIYSFGIDGFFKEATVGKQHYVPAYKKDRIESITIETAEGQKSRQLLYTYNDHGRVNRIEVLDNVNGAWEHSADEMIGYDAANRITSSSFQKRKGTLVTTFEYDGNGKLISVNWDFGKMTYFYTSGKLNYSLTVLTKKDAAPTEYRTRYLINTTKY